MLRADSASYSYDAGTTYEVAAVDGVTIEVTPGRLTLIAGETGSGKTTLLRLLAGLAAPTRGSVTVGGAPPEPASDDPTRRVGLLFQRAESQLFAESVEADVAFGPENLGLGASEARDAAHRALQAVDMDPREYGERSPFTLSGGEARRVALAGVLAMEPRYVLLDEPTAGLDAAGRAAVRAAVSQARVSCGVVVVTHDLEELLDLADDVVVLADGAVRFSGTIGEFVESASSPEPDVPVPATIALQVAAQRRSIRLASIETDPDRAAASLAEAVMGP